MAVWNIEQLEHDLEMMETLWDKSLNQDDQLLDLLRSIIPYLRTMEEEKPYNEG